MRPSSTFAHHVAVLSCLQLVDDTSSRRPCLGAITGAACSSESQARPLICRPGGRRDPRSGWASSTSAPRQRRPSASLDPSGRAMPAEVHGQAWPSCKHQPMTSPCRTSRRTRPKSGVGHQVHCGPTLLLTLLAITRGVDSAKNCSFHLLVFLTRSAQE
jgi:hypothetical protein